MSGDANVIPPKKNIKRSQTGVEWRVARKTIRGGDLSGSEGHRAPHSQTQDGQGVGGGMQRQAFDGHPFVAMAATLSETIAKQGDTEMRSASNDRNRDPKKQ